jgi:hypothetical protein
MDGGESSAALGEILPVELVDLRFECPPHGRLVDVVQPGRFDTSSGRELFWPQNLAYSMPMSVWNMVGPSE